MHDTTQIWRGLQTVGKAVSCMIQYLRLLQSKTQIASSVDCSRYHIRTGGEWWVTLCNPPDATPSSVSPRSAFALATLSSQITPKATQNPRLALNNNSENRNREAVPGSWKRSDTNHSGTTEAKYCKTASCWMQPYTEYDEGHPAHIATNLGAANDQPCM